MSEKLKQAARKDKMSEKLKQAARNYLQALEAEEEPGQFGSGKVHEMVGKAEEELKSAALLFAQEEAIANVKPPRGWVRLHDAGFREKAWANQLVEYGKIPSYISYPELVEHGIYDQREDVIRLTYWGISKKYKVDEP